MCPCMVDIEIIDTRNGNEAQLVCAGTGACTCNDPTRKQLADLSYYPQETRAPSPPPAREMRRVASAGNLMKRSGSAAQLAGGGGGGGMGMGGMIGGMRRPPSSNRLHMNAYAAEQSRGSGGSELFDALLMAATDNLDKEQTKSQGEPPVSSRSGQRRQQQQQQQQMRINEVDSLQANMDALANSNAAAARQQTRPMLRRNSVSMIIENPVLAQTGAAESLLMNYWQHPFMPHMIMAGGDPDAMMMMGAAGLAGGGIGSLGGVPGGVGAIGGGGEEGQGDTDKADGTELQDGGGHAPDVNSVEGNFREGLLKHFQKQSSAVNLTRLAGGGGGAMLDADVTELKTRAEAAESKLRATEAAARKAAETIQVLHSKLNEAGVIDVPDVDSAELQTAEERIAQLQDELAKEQAERKNVEAKLKAATAAVVTTGAASLPGMPPLPPLPYAAAAAMLPMFGLNPYGNMAGGASKPPIPHHHPGGGTGAAAAAVNGVVSMMQKVASMPAMHHGGMSPASKPSPPGFGAAPPPPPPAAATVAAVGRGDVEEKQQVQREDDKAGNGKRAFDNNNNNMEEGEGGIKKVKHEDGEAAREERNGVEKEGGEVVAAAAAAS